MVSTKAKGKIECRPALPQTFKTFHSTMRDMMSILMRRTSDVTTEMDGMTL